MRRLPDPGHPPGFAPAFMALVDATPALVWIDGPDGDRLLVNRAWREFTGVSPADDLGAGWRARVHPDDVAATMATRATAVAARTPFEQEYRLRRADGDYRRMLDRGAPSGEDGTYIGSCLDIEDRFHERERRRLLDVIGAAMEAETTVARRRDVLLRVLVTEGVADMARLVDVSTTPPRTVAVAAHRSEHEEILAGLVAPPGLDESMVAVGAPQLFTVDEDYLASSPDAEQRALRRALDLCTAVFVPLLARGRVLGVLAAARASTSVPQDDEDAALLGEIGRRAATALDNAALLTAAQATTRRLTVLQHATAALSAAPRPRAVARVAVHQIGELLGTPVVGVWQRRDDGLVLLDGGGWAQATAHAWAQTPMGRRSPLVDTARDGEVRWQPVEGDAAVGDLAIDGCRSLLTLPLTVGDERVGVVGVGLPSAEELPGDDRAAALALADQCALALQRAGLLAAESLARRTAEALSDVVSALSVARSPEQVGSVIVRHALAVGATEAVVVLRAGTQIEVVAGPPGSMRLDAEHPVAHVVRTGQALWPSQARAPGPGRLPSDAVLPLLLDGRPIGAIALAFPPDFRVLGPGQRAIMMTAASQCAQALDRARLHAVEHEVADVLQRSLLPRELPRLARLAAAARYLPGRAGTQAGGDWYDLIPVDEHRVALAVGDVVGHGPAAAAVMGQLRSVLASSLLDGHGPAAALERLDRFAARVPGAQGSTCVCATLDWSTGELRVARAGHLPVLLVGPDGARYAEEGGGTVLAVFGRSPFTESATTLVPGSSVLLYTDGLVERRDEIIDDGLARLATAVDRRRDDAPDALADGVVADMLGDAPPHDDVALVVVRLTPAPLDVTLPAAPAALRSLRRAVTTWATAAGLPPDTADDLLLVVGEAAANAVEHAYPDGRDDDTFDTGLRRTAAGDIAVRVRDHGRWRPVPADPGYRGRGLQVIRAIARDVRVTTDHGTEVMFHLPVGPRADLPVPAPVAVSAGGADGLVVVVSGDLDLSTVDEVRTRLAAAAAGGGRVVADLRRMRHLSSAGVRMLLETADHAAQLSILATELSAAARVLRLTGVDELLPVRWEP